MNIYHTKRKEIRVYKCFGYLLLESGDKCQISFSEYKSIKKEKTGKIRREKGEKWNTKTKKT
ncbi:hypothetical protein DRJ22_02895 [Candidatus Woesearchaeota archaeon]|nr:MAG: hypothetical protein DRJ22_02895 [Candidatus Woesearchaeota archaeon]